MVSVGSFMLSGVAHKGAEVKFQLLQGKKGHDRGNRNIT